jgi:hypothetical protein
MNQTALADGRADTQEPTSGSQATAQEKFAMLYGMLKETQEWLFDFEFKQATFLFIVLGWIVSSDAAQAFFGAHPFLKLGMILLLAGVTSFHAWWVYMHHRRSRWVHQRLLALGYVPADYYEPQQLQRSLVLSFGLSHLLITLITALAVWFSA